MSLEKPVTIQLRTSGSKRKNHAKFFERTTIHGLNELFLAKDRYTRVFWGLVLLTCGSVMLYNLINLSIGFYESPMVTTVRTVLVDKFPHAIYCPMGIVGHEKDMKRAKVTPEDIVYFNDFFLYSNTRNM